MIGNDCRSVVIIRIWTLALGFSPTGGLIGGLGGLTSQHAIS